MENIMEEIKTGTYGSNIQKSSYVEKNGDFIDEKKLEEKIREFFEANFQYLKETKGHAIDERMKERALNQVLCYWKKNRETIEKAARSQVKLSLPEQLTPEKKYLYTLEGSIDVVTKDGKNCLYEITTESLNQICGDIKPFKEQLNVYSRLWKNLDKQNRIDELGVISTSVPKNVREAFDTGNVERIEKAMENWNPVVKIDYSEEEIEKMIENFGETVEKIQDCEFSAPEPEKLRKTVAGTGESYASHICSNCDIRFSCESYRSYKGLNKGADGNKNHQVTIYDEMND